MEPTQLQPDNELETARTVPFVALGWAALTVWAAYEAAQDGWRPLWIFPALVTLMGAGLLVLIYVSIEGLRQARALKKVTTTLDRPFLTIGEPARLSIETGADPASPVVADVHIEGREYTRTFKRRYVAANTGGGWQVKERLVHRTRACGAAAPEGARLDNLSFVVPTDIHPSVSDKPHGIDWTLRIRIRAGRAPVWDAKYDVRIRGRNGSGVSLDSKRQEFQIPEIANKSLPKLTVGGV